jgi:hypothetical protein
MIEVRALAVAATLLGLSACAGSSAQPASELATDSIATPSGSSRQADEPLPARTLSSSVLAEIAKARVLGDAARE